MRLTWKGFFNGITTDPRGTSLRWGVSGFGKHPKKQTNEYAMKIPKPCQNPNQPYQNHPLQTLSNHRLISRKSPGLLSLQTKKTNKTTRKNGQAWKRKRRKNHKRDNLKMKRIPRKGCHYPIFAHEVNGIQVRRTVTWQISQVPTDGGTTRRFRRPLNGRPMVLCVFFENTSDAKRSERFFWAGSMVCDVFFTGIMSILSSRVFCFSCFFSSLMSLVTDWSCFVRNRSNYSGTLGFASRTVLINSPESFHTKLPSCLASTEACHLCFSLVFVWLLIDLNRRNRM